jgi:hypothetical protein
MKIRRRRAVRKRRRNPDMTIKGLLISPEEIKKVDSNINYSFDELDLLLTQHRSKIKTPLYDELFLDPKTFDVIEFDGETFAVTMN